MVYCGLSDPKPLSLLDVPHTPQSKPPQISSTGRIQIKVLATFTSFTFLPPANEVWGKVMISHLSVSHSVHGGMYPSMQCVCPADTPPGRHPPRQTPAPPKMATEASGMHPTGMHSRVSLMFGFLWKTLKI